MYGLERTAGYEYSDRVSGHRWKSRRVVRRRREGLLDVGGEREIARILEIRHESETCLGFVCRVRVRRTVEGVETRSIKSYCGERRLSCVPLGIHEDSTVEYLHSIVGEGILSVHGGGRRDREGLLHVCHVLDTGGVPCTATVSRKTDHANG